MSDTNDPQAPYGHCTGCTDPRSEGTHQMGTIEHPLGSEEPGLMATFQPTERAPLLSDDDLLSMIPTRLDAVQPKPNGMSMQGCKAVRDFYESKITSGELRVVKTTRNSHENGWGCEQCDRFLGSEVDYNLCPGCGAQIVK